MMRRQDMSLDKYSYSFRLTTELIVALAIISQLFTFFPARAQYQIDSVVHILGDRVVKTSQQVDDSSNTLLRTYTSTDPKNNLRLEKLRYFSQFDADDKLIFSIASQWDTLMQDWNEAEKREIKYDENGRTIIMRESRRDDKEGWEQASLDSVIYYKDSIETFSYLDEIATKNVSYLDKYDNDYLSINYRWNTQSKAWDPWIKTDFENRKNGVIEESSTYLWKAGQWIPSEKTRYIFTSNSEISNGSITYSGDENGWQPEFRIARGYFADERLETDSTQHWSAEENRWNSELVITVTSYLKERGVQMQEQRTSKVNTESNTQELLFEAQSTYDDLDQLIFYQGISYEDSAPISGEQQNYIIDEHGNITKCTMLELDTNTNEWVEILEYNFIYRPDILWSIDGQTTIKAIHRLDTYPLSDRNKNVVSEAEEYRFEDGKKKLQEHILYYYSPIDSSM